MEGTLRVTPEQLINASGDLKTSAGTVQTITSNMTETVNSLTGSVWSGEAATQFISKFSGLQDDITRMCNMINEHSNDLDTMARSYQTAEQEAQNVIGGLSSDVIQ